MSESASTTKSKTWLWWALAIATLVLGFADLARGGETIAPILLVIGYCVLVPIAILK
jgi:amino acid transporter